VPARRPRVTLCAAPDTDSAPSATTEYDNSVQVRCCCVDILAKKSCAAGACGVLRGVSVVDLAGDHGGHASASAGVASVHPHSRELPRGTQLIVDAILVSCWSCWSWDNHPELPSCKHHTTGLKIQVVCDLARPIALDLRPADGCRHDTVALRASGVLDGIDPQNWIGDKATSGST
jgi:hypothetical protein